MWYQWGHSQTEVMIMSEEQFKPPINPNRFRAVALLVLVIGISLTFLYMLRPFAIALFLGAIFSLSLIHI